MTQLKILGRRIRQGWSAPDETISLPLKIGLNATTPLHQVTPEYLSFSIDISVLAGGYWWEGSGGTRRGLGTLRIPPLQLHSHKLDYLTQALAPAYLRIGGSEADKIHYFQAPAEHSDALILHKHTWDSLHQFAQRNQLKVALTVKYGLLMRRQHGQWRGSEIEKLLHYTQEQQYRLDACELGNELNAYWAFHGFRSQPRAHNLAADYRTFIQVMKKYQPDARIIGPGSAFWPRLGETIKPFSNITQRFLQVCHNQGTHLDIVDWHYYPFQSHRSPIRTRAATKNNFLDPHALNDFKKYSQQIKHWRDQYFPNAQIWTGETGSAQCGGQPKLSDRFISCFWWADQLGQGAVQQQSVMIRQSLIGGDYGLIDRLRLKPRPDYWLSWLWKQLMGTQVYSVESHHPLLRVYCHDGGTRAHKCLLLINLSNKPLNIDVQGLGVLRQSFCLSAKRLKSKRVTINGIKARVRRGQFSLDDFPQRPAVNSIARYSIEFRLYDQDLHDEGRV